MDRSRQEQVSVAYILPSRRLAGTRTEVLEQLDKLILGMVGPRELSSRERAEPRRAERTRALRLVPPVGALLFVLGVTTQAGAQPPTATTAPGPANPDVTYGGFLDVGYLHAFNDPLNKLFRSRGTAWHLNDLFVNMTGAYVKKKASEESRWGTELLVQTGKDDEIFGFSATAPNMAAANGFAISARPTCRIWHRRARASPCKAASSRA